MNNITVIGVDLAKNVFQVHAEDRAGNKVFNKQFKRAKFKELLYILSHLAFGICICKSE